MNTKIIYLAHTQQRILDDAVFSILNLIHQVLASGDCSVLVGTDSPEVFENLPVEVWPITRADVIDWKADIGFIHRTKPVFMQLVASRFPNHNLLYFDADTALKRPLSELLQQLNTGKCLMHATEGKVGSATKPVYKQVRSAISSGILKQQGLEDAEMFNAGVVGIPKDAVGLIEKVITDLDEAYPKLKIHIVEQMLFSYYLSSSVGVADVSAQVYHWWGKGLNTGPIISGFLEKTSELPLGERAKKAAELLQTIEATPMNPKLSFTQKLKRSVKKRFS